jgi:hypothetical protein
LFQPFKQLDAGSARLHGPGEGGEQQTSLLHPSRRPGPRTCEARKANPR